MCFPYRRSPSALRLREPTATAERGTTLGTRINMYLHSLCHALCAPLRNRMAQSRVLFVNLDARFARRPAARVTSPNTHIPLISTLRTSVRSGVGKAHPKLLIINY